jgi:hypothetical protein
LLLGARESALAFLPVGSPGNLPACGHDEVEVIDIQETDEAVDLVERVCASTSTRPP